MLSHFQTHPPWYDGVHLLLRAKWVSAKCYWRVQKPKVIQYDKMMQRPIVMSTYKSLAALAFVWALIFLRLTERLFYACVSVCSVFKLPSLIWRRICRKSLNPSLSCPIVCVCAGVRVKGGGDLRGCQMMQDALEHVRTRTAEAPARLTDTIVTFDAHASRAHKQQHP